MAINMPLAPLRFSVYLPAVRSVTGTRPRGGVVTQRTANPCTPVRFRARPPLLLPCLFVARVGLSRCPAIARGSFSVAPLPLDHERPPPAAHRRKILRQHQQAERNHPETEHRKKSEHAANDQGGSQCDSHRCLLRQAEMPGSDLNLAPAGVEIEKAFLGHRRRICLWSLQDHLIDPRIMPRTWALTVGLARTTHFLQKPLGKSERHLL